MSAKLEVLKACQNPAMLYPLCAQVGGRIHPAEVLLSISCLWGRRLNEAQWPGMGLVPLTRRRLVGVLWVGSD